jgi:2-polyprenyl-3-methyl-5-hydroxy-6-metoxy-1,4-benzoquinol methylase
MKEQQYDILKDIARERGFTSLGLMTNQVWQEDPKRLVFYLSRYKFVSRILNGFDEVLEVGCGDAFGSKIIEEVVKELTLSDFDEEFLKDIKNRKDINSKTKICEYNPIETIREEKQDGIYALDVIEHIPKEVEVAFLINLKDTLKDRGVLILGTPSLESQVYASYQSKIGHVNCKSAKEWKKLLRNHFSVVFQFSMNDEVVHTGFDEMSHYLFFVCVK